MVVGRFQTNNLHIGHIQVFERAVRNANALLVVLGSAQEQATKRNPFPAYLRKDKVEAYLKYHYPDVRVMTVPLNDAPGDDAKWSTDLDLYIEAALRLMGRATATIYHGRDSFRACYSGRYACVEVDTHPGSATAYRDAFKYYQPTLEDMHGILWATQNAPPQANVLATVDVAITSEYNELLVGRKKDSPLWRLPGGFVDATDSNIAMAAYRELQEECGIDVYLQFNTSMKINDPRFSVPVMTSLFTGTVAKDRPKAGDDLVELRWDTRFYRSEIAPEHHRLFEHLGRLTS